MNLDFVDQLDERQQRLLAGGTLVLLVTVLFVYVLLPQAKAYKTAADARVVLVDAAMQGQEVGAQLESLQVEVANLQKKLHGDMVNLPPEEMESYIIGRLQDVSWRNDVELISVKPGTGERVQIFTESLFQVELVGDYFDLYRWLGDVANELGFVVVKEYQMKPQQNIPDSPLLTARLTLASYRVSR
jgi:Tfp pilus assembly protein PilO